MAKELSSIIKIDDVDYEVVAKTAEKVAVPLTIRVVNGDIKEYSFDGSTDPVVEIKAVQEAGQLTHGLQVFEGKDTTEPLFIFDGSEEQLIRLIDENVTSVENHYAPIADSDATLSIDAAGATSFASWATTNLVTGINLQRDAKGHVTNVTVDAIKMPSNPDTGATSVEVTGTGNAVTTATYDAATRKITLSKNGTYSDMSFKTIAVSGQPSVVADGPADTLTVAAGTGIAITTDATNDKVTIGHTNSTVTAGSYNKVTVNDQGHVTAGSNPTSLAGHGITDAYTKTEVDALLAGLVSDGQDDPDETITSKYYFKY